jgi:hypothetical protein
VIDNRKRDRRTGRYVKDPDALNTQVCTKVQIVVRDEMDAIAEEANISRSELVRFLIDELLSDYAQNPAPTLKAIAAWSEGGDDD